MAIKMGYMPIDGYTKIDNEVCRIRGLSDQAYRLYGYLASQKNGFNVQEKLIMEVLGWSDKKVRRYKKELVGLDLLYLENVFKTHRLWVGSTRIGAKRVRDLVTAEEDATRSPIPAEELKRLREEKGI